MKKAIYLVLIFIFLFTQGSNESKMYGDVSNKIVTKNQKITDQEIMEIYNQFIKINYNNEYKLRYVPLPMHKNNLPWQWKNKDFPRIISLLEFERFVLANNISSQKALAINGAADPEWYYLSTKKIVSTNYAKNPAKYDLQTLDLEEKDFDFIMANQTFEHIYDPVLCLKNIYNHMRPGGILYFNVPTNGIPHSTPFHHYTGFTPAGIGAIVKAAGFEILSIGQWGNLEYLIKAFKTKSFLDYRALKNPGFNDFGCPIITWIFAIK